MTVARLIEILKAQPQDAQVRVFVAFDTEGPNSWGIPSVTLHEDGTVHIEDGGDE